MSDSDIGTHVPLSEVGCENQSDNDNYSQPHNQPSNSGLLTNMEALLTRLLAMPQQTSQSVASTNAVQLIKFDPDDEDADVKGWCRVSEIGAKETASESAMRLWTLIERIPKVEMSEEAVTGFVISVLSSKDHMIRRELNAYAITTRAQLFRTLGGISLKRRSEDNDGYDNRAKRPRLSDLKFNGKCHRCGVPGHKIADCKRRRDDPANRAESSNTDQVKDKSAPITCFTCGKLGHVSTSCPEKRGGAAVREVNTCEHSTSRGKLTTSSGEHICFLFDSGLFQPTHD